MKDDIIELLEGIIETIDEIVDTLEERETNEIIGYLVRVIVMGSWTNWRKLIDESMKEYGRMN